MTYKCNTVTHFYFITMSLLSNPSSINVSNHGIDRHFSTIDLVREKKFKLADVGSILRQSIESSYYSIVEVAELANRSNGTLHRWMRTPNLSEKEVALISESCPKLNMRLVYEALEENLGRPAPTNPYRDPVPVPEPELKTDPGIKISLDSDRYAGLEIPPDLTQKVADMILKYNQEQRKKSE